MSKTYTRADVASHNVPEDLWIIISGEVYNVTDFQESHPGGPKFLRSVAGKDGTKPFRKKHNEKILKTQQYEGLCIGKIVEDAQPPPKVMVLNRLLSWGRKKSETGTEVKEVLVASNGITDIIEEPVIKGGKADDKIVGKKALETEIPGKSVISPLPLA